MLGLFFSLRTSRSGKSGWYPSSLKLTQLANPETEVSGLLESLVNEEIENAHNHARIMRKAWRLENLRSSEGDIRERPGHKFYFIPRNII